MSANHPSLKTIARARLRLVEQRSDNYAGPGLEVCIETCLKYHKHDPWIATELAAYEESHPELVAMIRERRGEA
jgi:hypothetical protein